MTMTAEEKLLESLAQISPMNPSAGRERPTERIIQAGAPGSVLPDTLPMDVMGTHAPSLIPAHNPSQPDYGTLDSEQAELDATTGGSLWDAFTDTVGGVGEAVKQGAYDITGGISTGLDAGLGLSNEYLGTDFDPNHFKDRTMELYEGERGVFGTTDQGATPTEAPPEATDPTKVDPTSPQSVAIATEGAIQAEAQQKGQAMGKWYNDRSLNEGLTHEQEEQAFDLVKSVSSFLGQAFTGAGNALDMGIEGWMNLSPSTRTALIGAAATAWAYNKGWRKTAGDVAQGFAGLYSQERQNEVASAEAELARQGEAEQAITDRQNELADAETEREFKRDTAAQKFEYDKELAGIRAAGKASQLGNRINIGGQEMTVAYDMEQGDEKRVEDEIRAALLKANDDKSFWQSELSEPQIEHKVHQARNAYLKYIGGNRDVKLQVPFTTWYGQVYLPSTQ